MNVSALQPVAIPDGRQLARFNLLDEKDREIWLEFFGIHYPKATTLFCKMVLKGAVSDWEDWYYVVKAHCPDAYYPARFDRENIQPLFSLLEAQPL